MVFGTSLGRLIAVAHEANAVAIFTSAESQYNGTHTVTASIRWVPPQATMNRPKARKTHENGISRLALFTSIANVAEIAM